MHMVLREGFRGHSVVVTMNERRVYEAAGVTTDPLTARAAIFAVGAADRKARVAVAVSPGDLAATFEVDVAVHPHVAISLVGGSTVAFETSAWPFR